MDAPPRGAPAPGRLAAVLRGLCPRCRSGRIFRRGTAMNDRCPACDMRFSRESGYFLGAMYFSYAIAVPLLGILTGAVWFFVVPGWELHWALFPALVAFLPFVPAVFRYSRILWIHLDRAVDPGGRD